MATTAEIVRRFVAIRDARDAMKKERNASVCERETMVESEGNPTLLEPCWKAARKFTPVTPYSDGGQLYYDPPTSEWCQSCQRRQHASDAYKKLSQAHGGALRGLIRHARTLERPQETPRQAIQPLSAGDAAVGRVVDE